MGDNMLGSTKTMTSTSTPSRAARSRGGKPNGAGHSNVFTCTRKFSDRSRFDRMTPLRPSCKSTGSSPTHFLAWASSGMAPLGSMMIFHHPCIHTWWKICCRWSARAEKRLTLSRQPCILAMRRWCHDSEDAESASGRRPTPRHMTAKLASSLETLSSRADALRSGLALARILGAAPAASRRRGRYKTVVCYFGAEVMTIHLPQDNRKAVEPMVPSHPAPTV